MQLSLRRVNEVKQALDDRYVSISGSARISIFEPNIETRIAEERAEILSKVVLVDRLASISCHLGKEIARQEASAGITDLLEDQARLNAQKGHLTDLANYKPARPELLRGRIEAAEQTTRVGISTYSQRCELVEHEISVDVLTSSDLADFKVHLSDVSHQLLGIEDQLYELNSTTKVKLNDSDATLLREQGLL